MKNIRIIKTGINVSKIKAQLEQYKEDWGAQKKIEGTEQLDPNQYQVDAGVLQLVMGGIERPGQFVGDTEICVPTPYYDHHTEIVGFLRRNFRSFCRCGFLSLPVGGFVGQHVDFGSYYLTKDRYHLSIQGRYEYTVGDETIIVEPGTLLWFNNKVKHGTKNIADEVRITFVFDVPHHKDNP